MTVCDFCGVTQHNTELIFTGSKGAAICYRCVESAARRIAELRAAEKEPEKAGADGL